MGRRGPGSGLREARNAFEAAQWCRLFDALASPQSERLLPHLGLRTTDGEALRTVTPHVHWSLNGILARTQGPGLVRRVNAALADAYAALERQHGARLARGVFALCSDGFPGAEAAELMAAWEEGLRGIAADDGAATGLTAAKREVVVALVRHHLAAIEPLDTLAAEPDAGGAEAPAETDWLVTLARWRRHATVLRALARVLTAAERQRLALLPAADPWHDTMAPQLANGTLGGRDVMRAAGAGAPSRGAREGR